MKQCTKCKEWKEISEFVRNNKSKDGLSWWCKQCKKEHNEKTKDKILEYRNSRPNYDKEYYQQHKEEIKIRKQKERQKNREILKQRDKERHKRHKLSRNISKLICSSLHGNKSEQHWEDLVGYTIKELKQHLENQFTSEMTWNNYGRPAKNDTSFYWELDHIIPQNLFSFQTAKDHDFQICWSLMNLRPLEWHKNRSRPKDGSDISEELKQQILNQNI